MSEIEAKALAMVNESARDRLAPVWQNFYRNSGSINEALCRAIEREEATEARHAAEMRELKERFSEALTDWFGRYGSDVPLQFRPFILPAPDPLVEALNDMKDGRAGPTTESYASCLRAAMQARGYEWRQIGEAGE